MSVLLYPITGLYVRFWRKGRVPVLVYHRVCQPVGHREFDEWSVSPAAFERQMEWLRRKGYRTLSVIELCEIAEGRRGAPPRAVCVTFDDGYRNQLVSAVPILRRYGFRGTFFLVTKYIGTQAAFPWLLRSCSEKQLSSFDPIVWQPMDWTEAAAMAKADMELGSHTSTHPLLTDLGASELLGELMESARKLQHQISSAAPVFAAPFGYHSSRIRRHLKPSLQRAGYRVAFNGRYGAVRRGDDPLDLGRIPVYGADSLLVFRLKVSGVMDWLRRLQGVWAAIGSVATGTVSVTVTARLLVEAAWSTALGR